MCNFLFQRRGDRAFDTHRPSKRRLVQHNLPLFLFSLLPLISFLSYSKFLPLSTQSHHLPPRALSQLIPSSSHILYTLLFPLFSLPSPFLFSSSLFKSPRILNQPDPKRGAQDDLEITSKFTIGCVCDSIRPVYYTVRRLHSIIHYG